MRLFLSNLKHFHIKPIRNYFSIAANQPHQQTPFPSRTLKVSPRRSRGFYRVERSAIITKHSYLVLHRVGENLKNPSTQHNLAATCVDRWWWSSSPRSYNIGTLQKRTRKWLFRSYVLVLNSPLAYCWNCNFQVHGRGWLYRYRLVVVYLNCELSCMTWSGVDGSASGIEFGQQASSISTDLPYVFPGCRRRLSLHLQPQPFQFPFQWVQVTLWN